MKIRVWKKHPQALLPQRASKGSIGFDIFALKKIEVPPGEQSLIPTGLVIEAPDPFAMFIFPRSSLFRKKGLIFPHSVGVIDFDYCGEEDELMVPVLNLKKDPIIVEQGERIAQLVFLKTLETTVKIEEIDHPPKGSSRGGFGSTGGYE